MILAKPTPEHKELWLKICDHVGPQITTQFIEIVADQLKIANIIGTLGDVLKVSFSRENFDLGKIEFTLQFKSLFYLRLVNKNIESPDALRLALVHCFLSEFVFDSKSIFCSVWIDLRLSNTGRLIRMIRSKKGLVSSKCELADKPTVRYLKFIPKAY